MLGKRDFSSPALARVEPSRPLGVLSGMPSRCTCECGRNVLVKADPFALRLTRKFGVQRPGDAKQEATGVSVWISRLGNLPTVLKGDTDPAGHGVVDTGDGFLGRGTLADTARQFFDLGDETLFAFVITVMDDRDPVRELEIFLKSLHRRLLRAPPRSREWPWTHTRVTAGSSDRSSTDTAVVYACRPSDLLFRNVGRSPPLLAARASHPDGRCVV